MIEVTNKQTTMPVTACRPHKYYGVWTPSDTGIILAEKDGATYTVRSTNQLTDGNRWTAYQGTLRHVIEQLLDAGSFRVYCFDTPKELFKWLAG